jgi:hypothetical protein
VAAYLSDKFLDSFRGRESRLHLAVASGRERRSAPSGLSAGWRAQITANDFAGNRTGGVNSLCLVPGNGLTWIKMHSNLRSYI